MASNFSVKTTKPHKLLSAVRSLTLIRFQMRWLLPIIALSVIAEAQLNASDVTYIADGPETNISSAGEPRIFSERLLMRSQDGHRRERLRRLLHRPRECTNRQTHRPNRALAVPSPRRAEALPSHFHSQHASLRRVPDRRRAKIFQGGGGRSVGILLSGGAQDI